MTCFSDLFPRVIHLSAVAGIVILFVLLARVILKNSPKVFSYALWGIVLIRLLLPVSIPSPVSAIPQMQTVSSTQINMSLPVIAFETPQNRQENIENLQQSAEQHTTYVPEKTTLEPMTYLTLVWMAGMGAMTVYGILSYLAIRKKTRICVPIRKNIYLADDIQSPFVLGLIRPKIYLPDHLGSQEQEYIILHEQCHIRRMDHWLKAAAFAALTIHWFNPLVWIAFVLASRDMEMSCDEAVIRQSGEKIRSAYSASLLTLATGRRIIAGAPLAFGEGDTKGRIRNLSNWKRPAFWVIMLTVLVCLILAVCLLTDPMGMSGGDGAGVTWHYGTVTDYAAGVRNEGDSESRPCITLQRRDGETEMIWLAAGCEVPQNIQGQYVTVCTVPDGDSGLSVAVGIDPAAPFSAKSMEEGVRKAVIAMNSGKYLEGGCKTAHFQELSRETMHIAASSTGASGTRITVYGVALYQEFDLQEGLLENVSGGVSPAVLSFFIDGDGNYSLMEYWMPRDGSYYPVDVKAKFRGRPYPDAQIHMTQQRFLYDQAMEYFAIGTDGIIQTLIRDICIHEQWSNGFEHMMEQSSLERELLISYGSDTLTFCFSEFLRGEQHDLRGQVMAYVSCETMEAMGESVSGDWKHPASWQEWFDAFASNALQLNASLSSEALMEKHPGSWLYLKLTGNIVDVPNWGITLSVENVSASGLTLKLHQSGGFRTGNLITGRPYWIEVYENGVWQSASLLVEEAVWTMEGILIKIGGETTFGVNWTDIYGQLPPGHYRIGKSVSLRTGRESGDSVFYAEFTIP